MIRIVTWASWSVMLLAASAQAQITSSPVVTSWPAEVRITNYAPPVAPACNSCATGSVAVAQPVAVAPVTTYYAPVASYAVPVVTYPQPTTSWRWPWSYRTRPTVTYMVPPPAYVPTVTYYSPMAAYRMPTPPVVDVTSVPVVTAPTTTYYAPTVASPAVVGPAVVPAPAPVRSGCGCSGR